MIVFEVDGIPRPKGSTRAFVRHGRAVITAANKKTAPWARTIIDVAQRFAPPVPFDEPVEVWLHFRLPRLAGHSGKHGLKPSAPTWQSTKPDIDKLVRAALDALTVAGFWSDDSRVASLSVQKVYSDAPGVTIFVGAVAAFDLGEDRRAAGVPTLGASNQASNQLQTGT